MPRSSRADGGAGRAFGAAPDPGAGPVRRGIWFGQGEPSCQGPGCRTAATPG